jgi:exo-1,4-beta-D-glucosaminidase
MDEYLYRADMLNYESTKAMFESFRAHWPHTTGIVQWMLNGARPGIYWQLYDYYGQPNASYYGVKKANAPVQLIYDYYTKAVYAVNETMEPASYKASMKMLKDGQTSDDSQQIEVAAGTVIKVFDIDSSGAPAIFLFLKLTDDKDNCIATNEYFVVTENDTYDWPKTTWVNTPITKYASYAMLDGLCTKTCELSVKPSAEGLYEATVSNPSDKVAFMIRLTAKDQNGELICPAYWSDNYLILPPGESRTVSCKMPSLAANTKVSIQLSE